MIEPSPTLAPVIPREQLSDWSDEQRRLGKRIVFTNGCYDLLHEGHLRSFLEARKLGDLLLVAVNDDASVRQLKGGGRPILPEKSRVLMLRSLRAVDAVTIFADSSSLPTIRAVRPAVLAKGSQYEESGIVGSAEVRGWGGRVVRLPMVEGISTTQLLQRIRGIH
jgi:D-beta-D-heptose 7-phosphate kinase/D-beta-D-heptose 1-phosphate adenosyltransferase